MYYALTVNPNHLAYTNDINEVSEYIIKLTQSTYLEIVNHQFDHYHVLIDTQLILTKETVEFKHFHYDVIKNLKAYQKYMHSHDVVDNLIWGEMGYYEKPNNDDMIQYAISHGLQKTVLKYGITALRVYQSLKMFLNDLNGQKDK